MWFRYYTCTSMPYQMASPGSRSVSFANMCTSSARASLSGLLAFGKAPQAHLPSAYVEGAVYRGNRLTSDDLVHGESIKGRIDTQIDDSTAFVERRAEEQGYGKRVPEFGPSPLSWRTLRLGLHRDRRPDGPGGDYEL